MSEEEVGRLEDDCKRLALLLAMMPPSRRRQRAAAEKYGIPAVEMLLMVQLELNRGQQLLAAWPEDGPDWLTLKTTVG